MNRRNQYVAPWLVAASALALASHGSAQTATQERGEQTATSVDLNEASVNELADLPGIGPSKAEAIVSFRNRHRFRRPEDILRVRGIGRATFRSLRDRISVSNDHPNRAPAKRDSAPSRSGAGEGGPR